MLDESIENVAVLNFNPMLVRHTEAGLSATSSHHSSPRPVWANFNLR